MVEGMADGAVVVDMAADQGGNCELTEAGEVVEHHGVHIVGHGQPAVGHADARQLPLRPQRGERARR